MAKSFILLRGCIVGNKRVRCLAGQRQDQRLILIGSCVLVALASSAPGQILNESAKLLASDGAESDYFGYSVSTFGDVALVSAHADDDNGNNAGAAYVFRWSGTEWLQQEKLLAADGDADDLFGYSVSVFADTAIIGAQNDDSGTSSGSAYVFRWDGIAWTQEQKLLERV